MRIAMISICMLLIGISAYAEDFFPNSEIKDLQVYKVDKAQGTAWIRDRDGNKAVVAKEYRARSLDIIFFYKLREQKAVEIFFNSLFRYSLVLFLCGRQLHQLQLLGLAGRP